MSVFEKIKEKLEEESFMMFGKSGELYGIHIDLSKALLVIEQAEEEYNNNWIPISKELPEDDKDVLVQYDTGRMGIAWYQKNFGWDSENIQNSIDKLAVIAWQSLPEPYQKGEQS